MKCEFFTVFPWKMIGNLHVPVGTSNGLVRRDLGLATSIWAPPEVGSRLFRALSRLQRLALNNIG